MDTAHRINQDSEFSLIFSLRSLRLCGEFFPLSLELNLLSASIRFPASSHPTLPASLLSALTFKLLCFQRPQALLTIETN
jgi:hypothetical protein